ncbi:hypothetical protein G6F60_015234 [Rhizopus arrhizus]|nr:hypothetical protein G6F60_015234 [Rhizopus arrhizus]
MDAAAATGNRIDVHLFDHAARIQLFQQLTAVAVGGVITELRRDHRAIDRQVVDVAHRQIVVVAGGGHRHQWPRAGSAGAHGSARNRRTPDRCRGWRSPHPDARSARRSPRAHR